jgi:hypothetical protein
MAIAKMQGLRFVQVTTHSLSNQGLAAILDNCMPSHQVARHTQLLQYPRDPKMQARIKTKKLLMNNSWDGR